LRVIAKVAADLFDALLWNDHSGLAAEFGGEELDVRESRFEDRQRRVIELHGRQSLAAKATAVNSSKQNGAVHPWHHFKLVPGVDGTNLVAEVAGAGQ
jgi:hypothetical protein